MSDSEMKTLTIKGITYDIVDGRIGDLSDIEIENVGSIVEAINYLVEHGGGGSGASTWNQLTNKPFSTLGSGLKVVNDELQVDTANAAEQDNTKPITSAAVYTEVGNIAALLHTI